ncbi:MAG: hypothetical protein JWO94_331 [Verrucomicrobiaceae bacterium]|nr:hypothetical protein [Verrucomicrobiaceae bacterium]
MISLPSLPKIGLWMLALSVLLNCSCAGPGSPRTTAAGTPIPKGWWRGDGVSGKPKIVIDLSQQQVRYFKGGQLVGASPISSGRESHETMTGTYHIIEKDKDHRSSLYGAFCDENRQIVVPDVDETKDERPPGTHFIGASMPYFMRISGGVGMHEGYLPGYPASHGCIRLPAEMAETFYNATPQGTPVEIVGDASMAAATPLVLTPPDSAPPAATKKTAASPARYAAATPDSSLNQPTTTYVRTVKRSNGWLRAYQKPAAVPFGTTQYLQ